MTNSGTNLMLHYYEGFGAKSFDSKHYARAFRHDAPHNFGMQVAQLFSASNLYNNKVMTRLTMASGNHFEITNDVYRWTLMGDDAIEMYVVESAYSDTDRLGLAGQRFKITLDKGYLDVSSVLMTEDNTYPMLLVVETPVQKGEGWVYTVELQSSRDSDFIPGSLVAPSMRIIDASSSVVTEMNDKGSGIAFGSQMDLQCQIGAFARRISITDKTIRKEINAVKSGQSVSSIPAEQRISEGAAFAIYSNGKKIEKGAFITRAEEMMLNRVELDREIAMVYGKISTRIDPSTGYVMKTGPGFRELVLDGETIQYNGTLTLNRFINYFMDIFLRRIPSEQRKVKVSTGEGGLRLFHQMIADEASGFLLQSTLNLAVKQTSSSYTSNALQYGYQFTKVIAPNGLEIELYYDPMKDDLLYCGTTHPENPKYTIDSFRFDIMDFGTSDGSGSNMAMVTERGVDSYAMMGNMVDPRTGVVNTGAKVSSFNKGVEFMREISGGLWIKDVSRIGSLIFNPTAA